MDTTELIQIKGARENNLKNISVDIPHCALTVITGLSGSGKSSLAFDTLYAEGQRRYVESMSAYARQFLERIPKPDVDSITGVCPAIAIKQKGSGRNPRSTVGTVTEIHDFLRLLYARAGEVICRECGKIVKPDSPPESTALLLRKHDQSRVYIAFALSDSSFLPPSGEKLPARELLKAGYNRLVFPEKENLAIRRLPDPALEKESPAGGYVLVDRMAVKEENASRLNDSLESAFAGGQGKAAVFFADAPDDPPLVFSERMECCGVTYREPDPRLFSFNNPYGACPRCHGFGDVTEIDEKLVIPDQTLSIRENPVDPFRKSRFDRLQKKLFVFAAGHEIPLDTPWEDLQPEQRALVWKGGKGYPGIDGFFKYLNRKKYKVHIRVMLSRYRSYHRCPECGGERLCLEARDVQVGGRRLGELNNMPISRLRDFFSGLVIPENKSKTGGKIVSEINKRLEFLDETGLEYLSLERVTSTLSGGEMQRIHLAASLGSMLSGVLYVLDEPSIGLHPRDQGRLVSTLEKLRNLDNTIAVVEHEREIIDKADHIIDLGPGAGEAGGEVVYSGPAEGFRQCADSLTAAYLSGAKSISVPPARRKPGPEPLVVEGAACNNLKNISVSFPVGVMTCVTGVSGSGKSTLVHDVLHASLKRLRDDVNQEPVYCSSVQGWDQFSSVVLVDQSPIGKTPRSNPLTYLKLFDQVRKIFGELPGSVEKGFSASEFSFNRPGGRCDACQGSGIVSVDMQFLADVELPCEFCKGKRYNETILDIRYRGRNIAEVLDMTVTEALSFFRGKKALIRGLKVLDSVGLGYLRLGQPSTKLSGGEAQRIKLASFLAAGASESALFIFDEPTTGLHFEDIRKLLAAFNRLLEHGSTLIIIEHNLDVIKYTDWVIDLGPGGGDRGGRIVAQGTPETVSRIKGSATGEFLRRVLKER